MADFEKGLIHPRNLQIGVERPRSVTTVSP